MQIQKLNGDQKNHSIDSILKSKFQSMFETMGDAISI